MTTSLKIILTVSVIIILTISMTMRPIPNITESEANSITGIVKEVKESGTNDISFILEDVDIHFYINRGEEKGLSIQSLTQRLSGKEVEIMYPTYWTLLDPMGKIKHVSRLSIDEEVLFNELREK